ncbi:Gmad2 immunoglobulin-like domain-containing protein [Brevibacillus borstelensis]|jgi:Immunoglobulin-like domain of bacterial spore germination|uniref:Gmad2 immunoglobulin-like domain-containing protein n=1 Tax=Brevibacillus borstelensis TaxID=45462 RepID=UPI0015622D6F|nr:Gmad2 immunoglobulin-like domain-containing protein [Brevibacillus borstelensis]MBE5396692.1 sporulation protein [Brevibacillus borstelensis]MED1743371.1 Gmad2 immunoglobulin-like domain-containing protein [Brevibacillus borstelensis]MED1874112.1 Gmad2 immunoglobulin-like domain-containing protein [Brevibacillus borstelensis]MED2007690.1 Gmad2 immunoglobulin-like domain-containing protein [Brevibacillus borstelensis]WNF04113.1 Gmad2 immunoglobulin-like domain-containing protein [Brevibacill
MKKLLSILLIAVLLQGCTSSKETPSTGTPAQPPATEQPAQQPSDPAQPETPQPGTSTQPTDDQDKNDETNKNDSFHVASVEKTGEDTFTIKGKARVFEGNFQYVVEDGHNELTKGNVQTSAGAPEWGDFEFTVKVKKDQPNSTLTLVLFESSPKDGSRRMELPIALP